MNTKCVMLQKDAPERKPKPAAFSSLQAAMCCHIQGVETGKVRMSPFWSTARHMQCQNQSPGLPQFSHSPFPQPGLQLQKKNQIKFFYASAHVSKSFASKNTWCCKWRQTWTTGEVLTVKWNLNVFRRSGQNMPASLQIIRQTFFSSLTQERRNLLYLPIPLLVYTKPCITVARMISPGKPGI